MEQLFLDDHMISTARNEYEQALNLQSQRQLQKGGGGGGGGQDSLRGPQDSFGDLSQIGGGNQGGRDGSGPAGQGGDVTMGNMGNNNMGNNNIGNSKEQRLVPLTPENEVRLLLQTIRSNTASCKQLEQQLTNDPIVSFSLSPNGSFLAALSKAGFFKVFDVAFASAASTAEAEGGGGDGGGGSGDWGNNSNSNSNVGNTKSSSSDAICSLVGLHLVCNYIDCRRKPRQMVWCGEDCVALYLATNPQLTSLNNNRNSNSNQQNFMLLRDKESGGRGSLGSSGGQDQQQHVVFLGGPSNDWIPYQYSHPIYLIGECDGARIIGMKNELLQRVAPSVELIYSEHLLKRKICDLDTNLLNDAH
jgi:hypothetical protein